MTPDTDLAGVQEIWRRHGMLFRSVENPHMRRRLPPGTHYGRVTRRTCDCGTAVGCALEYEAERAEWEQWLQKQIRRRARQGWDAERLECWVATQRAEHAAADDSAEYLRLSRPEAARWCRVLHDLIAPGHCRRVGLLRHAYRYGLEDEPRRLAGRKLIALRDLTVETIFNVRPDVLHEFCRKC